MRSVEENLASDPSPSRTGIRIIGSGEMAALIREHDWGATALGPLDRWPDALAGAVNLMLACAFPSLIFWGPEMLQFYNDAFRPLIGEKHPGSLGQPARLCWQEVWHLVGSQLEGVLERGETFAHEKVLVPILRGGQLRDVWWNYSYSPVFTPSGEVGGILVVCQDVTGELAATRNLRASEEQALRILQSIGDGVIVTDARACITRINPVAESLTGWKARECIGRPLREILHIVHEMTREVVDNPVEKVLKVGEILSLTNHTLLIRRDGSEVPIDDSGAPIRDADGSICGAVLVFRSVAERRRTANLLRQSEARLKSIFSTSLEYMGLLSPEGRLLEANRASLEFAGNSREEVIGRYFWDGPWFIHTPGAPELVREAVALTAAGEAVRRELSLFRPSGEVVHFDFSITPVFDAEGNVIFLVPEGRDIRELKRAQRALMESEKIAAVGRLASSIAHEINNPLEAVTNLLYLARQTASPAQAQEFLLAADHELRRVSAIANQTLRFHKQASRPQAIQADELFSTVLSIYEGRLRNSNISVEIQHRTTEAVLCFQGDVRQVLNNLVGNAVDAMGSGGRLLIRSCLSTDWTSGRRGVVFTVADTGTGMSAETREHIYEPFFTTKGIGGTGLGLWVSREVVERHRGSLRVRSCQGALQHGTVFRFFLPLKPEIDPHEGSELLATAG